MKSNLIFQTTTKSIKKQNCFSKLWCEKSTIAQYKNAQTHTCTHIFNALSRWL